MNCTCCYFTTWNSLQKQRKWKSSKEFLAKSGGILLNENNRILLVQSRANKWGFPKGSLEPGETFEECAEREVFEETSFKISVSDADPKIKFHKGCIFFFKETNVSTKSSAIKLKHILKPENDCTGICWMRLSCLKRNVKDHPEYFTTHVRSFAKKYFT